MWPPCRVICVINLRVVTHLTSLSKVHFAPMILPLCGIGLLSAVIRKTQQAQALPVFRTLKAQLGGSCLRVGTREAHTKRWREGGLTQGEWSGCVSGSLLQYSAPSHSFSRDIWTSPSWSSRNGRRSYIKMEMNISILSLCCPNTFFLTFII